MISDKVRSVVVAMDAQDPMRRKPSKQLALQQQVRGASGSMMFHVYVFPGDNRCAESRKSQFHSDT